MNLKSALLKIMGMCLIAGFVSTTSAHQGYLKINQLKDGLYDVSTFKNQVVNGLKIDDCVPTASDDEKAVDGRDVLRYHHNVCTDKLSKQLLHIIETTKPNFANGYIFALITVQDAYVGKHFAYVLLDPKNKSVISLPEIYTTSDGKKPSLSYLPTGNTACTLPKSKTNQSVFINVPTIEERVDESYVANNLQCMKFEKGRFYSLNKEEYMRNLSDEEYK